MRIENQLKCSFFYTSTTVFIPSFRLTLFRIGFLCDHKLQAVAQLGIHDCLIEIETFNLVQSQSEGHGLHDCMQSMTDSFVSNHYHLFR